MILRLDKFDKESMAKVLEPFAGRVAIYGAGRVGALCVNYLQGIGVSVIAVGDANPEKWGNRLLGVPVLSPADLANIIDSNILLIVAIKDYSRLDADAFVHTNLYRHLADMGFSNIAYLFADDDLIFPMNYAYDPIFFKELLKGNDPEKTVAAARDILKLCPQTYSVVDIGCGVGAWLEALRLASNGNSLKVLGVDGEWVPRETLLIQPHEFLPCNLAQGFPDLRARFDLALCLEVGEHLPSDKADSLIAFLTSLSDRIVFSAAIPGQGGDRHINEQWPAYWEEKFLEHGYLLLDVIRPRIWDLTEVSACYRQNMMLAVKKKTPLPKGVTGQERPLSLVHPDIFDLHMKKLQELYTHRL